MEQEIKIIVLVNGDTLISAVEEVAALDIGDPNHTPDAKEYLIDYFLTKVEDKNCRPYTISQDASKPTRNGTFILMIETLIASTIITVSCADITTLVDRAKVYPDISEDHRQEVIELYYDFGEKQGLDCRDAKAD